VTDDSSERERRERRGGHLGFVAHEIRNPLSTALWSAELLTRMTPEERGSARGEKLSAMCLRSIARVRHLVEDHFLCERLDAGGITLRREAVPLKEAVDAAVARRGPDQGQVTVALDGGLTVSVDRTLLERALEALVAVAGRDGTPVRVSASAEEETVTLVLAGAAAAADSLHDPVKGSPSDPKGRALALPLARRVADALGGALTATGGGYLLSLPRGEAYAPRPKPAPPP
jgi:two-component system sensor histidine kinase KdpD